MRGILVVQLLKCALLGLVVLVLYGFLPAGQMAMVLGLFILVRLWFLVAEARREPMTLERWQVFTDDLTRAYESSPPSVRTHEATLFNPGSGATAHDLAKARVQEAARRYIPPRGKWELAAEVLGLLAFAALLPVDVALCTRDFFSLRIPLGWLGATVAVISIVLYGLPHYWEQTAQGARNRVLWWTLPFPLALAVLIGAIQFEHPYLNIFHPDHKRLAAERVLSLKSIIVAGRHADWVLDYAQHLDEQGAHDQAVAYYREALRLDAGNEKARLRLAALEGGPVGSPVSQAIRPSLEPAAPYWKEDLAFAQLPSCRIARELENLEQCSIVLVRMGEVSNEVLQGIGHAVRNELGLPVFLADQAVALPESTRTQGLLTGRQWHHKSLVQAFQSACQPFPGAPVKYLLVTPADIYDDGANYVFSVSYEYWAFVSLARLGRPGETERPLAHRAAKQSLCALLKTFRVPPSPDRNCVTSYVRSLDEFDAKGNRPNAASDAVFRQSVTEINKAWRNLKRSQ